MLCEFSPFMQEGIQNLVCSDTVNSKYFLELRTCAFSAWKCSEGNSYSFTFFMCTGNEELFLKSAGQSTGLEAAYFNSGF